MIITIEGYDNTYSASIEDDSTADQIKELFDRLLIAAGFNSDIRCADGGVYKLEAKDA